MRTTVDLPDQLFKQIKARAALSGVKMKDFIIQALTMELMNRSSPLKKKPVKLPIVRGAGGPMIKHLSNKVIHDLEQKEEVEGFKSSFRR